MIFSYFGRFLFRRRQPQTEIGEPSVIAVVDYDKISPILDYARAIGCPTLTPVETVEYELITQCGGGIKSVLVNYNRIINGV